MVKLPNPVLKLLVCGFFVFASLDAFSQEKELFIEAEVFPPQALLHQQVLYSLRLYRDSHLQRGYFLTPEIPQAIVRLKKNLAPRQVEYKGRAHELVEQQYYLYPQSSGEIQIPAPVFSSRELFVQGKPSLLRVLPGKNLPWLIASNLIMEEKWSAPMDDLTVGHIVERKIKIKAKNTLSLFLPEIELPTQDGFDSQRLPAKLSDTSAERLERHRLMFKKAGAHTLPAIKIKWWNSNNNQFEITQLPPRRIDIKPAATVSLTTIKKNTQKSQPISSEPEPDESEVKPLLYWLLGFGTLATVLLTAGYFRLRLKLGNFLSFWRLKQQLTHACQNNNAHKVKELLLQWYGEARMDAGSLIAIAQLSHDPARQKVLLDLDKYLYGRSKGDWQGLERLPLILQLLKEHSVANQIIKSSVLKPLWRI